MEWKKLFSLKGNMLIKKKFFKFILIISFFLLIIACKKSSLNLKEIEVSGIIDAIEVEIRSQVQGEIKEILIEEGQQVKKGDLLCLLDNEKLYFKLNQIRAGLEGAKLKLKLYEKGTKKELIAIAKNQLESVEKELELAKKDQQRMTRLFNQGAVSRIQKEKADLKLKLIKEKYESALENYRLALRGKEKEEIKIVEAEIRNLEAQEKLLLRQIKDTEIRSPIDGYVEIKHVEVGELALPRTILFTLLDLKRTYVKAYIPERFIGLIKRGDLIKVVSDSYPNKVYRGKVDYISDEAEFVPKDVQTKEERLKLVFMIKSYIENPNRELKPGMPVDVKIVIGESK
jgi:HlyD family secretion protein